MRKTKERNEPRFCADSSHWCRKGHHTPSCHPPVVVVAWTLVATSQLLHWSVPEGPAFCQPHTTKLPSINPSTTLHLQSTYTLTCSTPFPIDFPTHPSFFLFSFFLSTAGFVLSESHGPDLTWPFVMRGRPRKCHQLTYLPREISFLTFSSNDKPGTAAFGCQMIRIHGNPGANHGKLHSTLLLQEFRNYQDKR